MQVARVAVMSAWLMGGLAGIAGTYLWSWIDEAVFAASAASKESASDPEALKKLDRLLAEQGETMQSLAAIQQELQVIKVRVTH